MPDGKKVFQLHTMANTKPFETLDPENWDEMRQLAHRMVDDALDYIQSTEGSSGLASRSGRGRQTPGITGTR